MIVSSSQPLGQLLRLGKFAPARIQRAYQWQTTEVARLLDDLVATFQRMQLDPGEPSGSGTQEIGEENSTAETLDIESETASSPVARRTLGLRLAPDMYFLGTVILLKPRNSVAWSIYDGLQRITTATLLISALRDTWPAMPSAIALEIGDILFDRRDKKRRLSYPTTGRTLDAIVDGGTLNRSNLNDGDLRMREVAAFLRKQFDDRWSSERRAAFLEFLSQAVMVTVTETDNHSVAYQMFIGANARGLRLSIGDIVKSLIADLVRANGGTVAQVDACAAAWTRAQQILQRDFDNFIHATEVYQFRAELAENTNPRAHDTAHTTGEKLQELFDETTPPEEICAWIARDFTRMAGVFERARQHHRLDKSAWTFACANSRSSDGPNGSRCCFRSA